MEKVTNIRSEEELKELQMKKLKKGIKVLAVVGIGAGLYGFKLGRRYGHNKGYLQATEEIITVWKEHSEELIKLNTATNNMRGNVS